MMPAPTRERLERWYASGERGQGYESVAFDSPEHNDILLCPMTRKPSRRYFPRTGGDIFLAWGLAKRPDSDAAGSEASYFGSYGLFWLGAGLLAMELISWWRERRDATSTSA